MSKNYQVGNPTPEAFITKNKQRVKQFNGTVYLNDGDNFEIELFNPKSEKVLAKISLDGKRISSSGIVIRPGERVFLERYIDSNNKFVYSTYTVNGNNQQVQQAIKSNGDLKVEFFDLYTPPNWSHNIYYGGTVTTGSAFVDTTTGTNTTFTYTSNSTPTFGCYYDASVPISALNTDTALTKRSKSIETGTVEKGSASNQDFQYTYDNFSSYCSYTSIWKILPISQKPVTSNEIKVFCTNCGTRKRKQSHKFCPSCGTQFE